MTMSKFLASRMWRMPFKAGELVLRRGSKSRDMFLVQRGELDITYFPHVYDSSRVCMMSGNIYTYIYTAARKRMRLKIAINHLKIKHILHNHFPHAPPLFCSPCALIALLFLAA